MIQANELRIGNIVLRTKWLQRYCKKPETWEYKQIIVDANDILACKVRPDYFKPIPLTPEILEMGGLIREGENFRGEPMYFFTGAYNYRYWFVFTSERILCYSNGTKDFNYPHGMKYLHQLQNLASVFAGVELFPTFKPNLIEF